MIIRINLTNHPLNYVKCCTNHKVYCISFELKPHQCTFSNIGFCSFFLLRYIYAATFIFFKVYNSKYIPYRLYGFLYGLAYGLTTRILVHDIDSKRTENKTRFLSTLGSFLLFK